MSVTVASRDRVRRARTRVIDVEPLRIGVLGASRIAANAIVGPAQAVGARLVAVAARDRSRAVAFAAAHGVEQVVDTYSDVLNHPDVEVVYNPLANGLHAPWNLAAVTAGRHVLSEKPFASDAQEAAEVRDAGRSAGVVVAEAFHYRYHPLMLRVIDLVRSGQIGELLAVRTVADIRAPGNQDPRWSYALAGGAIMDIGCYGLHAHRVLAPWAGGEPRVADARGGERAGSLGVDEWSDVDLTFPSGATGTAHCSMAADEVTMTLEITGTRGSLRAENFILPHLDDRLTVRTDGTDRVEHLGTRPSYCYQLDSFTSAVRGGTGLPTDSDDAVTTMQLVDRAYEALGLGPRPRSQL